MTTSELKELKTHTHLQALCITVLRPIIGILMRAGVPFDPFAQAARRLYVEIARGEFGIRGRHTNTSRVAMLTGLTRAKVKQELDIIDGNAIDENVDELDKARHASRILLGWHTDKRFLDEHGKPKELEISDGNPSFEDLYESFSGKVVPSTSMLKELLNVGAIAKTSDGRVIAKSRMYAPHKTDPAALERICQVINDLASTSRHNLYCGEKELPRFERIATNQLIPASKEKEFNKFLEDEGQAFLEKVDNWMSQAEAGEDSESSVRIGVGLFQIHSPPIKKNIKLKK